MKEKAPRKVIVITDWAADLPPDDILQKMFGIKPIPQIPLYVSFGSDNYRAGIDLDNKEFNRLIQSSGFMPKTATASRGYITEFYQELAKSELDILSVHLGSNMSGMVNEAKFAAEAVGGHRIEVVDTGTVSMAEGLMAIAFEKAAMEGASMDELLLMQPELAELITLRAATPNLEFLKNSGRLSWIQSQFTEKLDIFPIAQIDHSKVKPVGFIKQKLPGRAINWLLDYAQEQGDAERVAIVDFIAQREADTLMERLLKETKLTQEMIYRGPMGQITAGHGGPGTYGMIVQKNGILQFTG